MITLMNCFCALSSILLLPFSPFFYLILSEQLSSECNNIASANVTAINTIDMFRCQLDMFIPDYNRNVTFPIACYEIGSSNSTDIMVALNHYYEDSCFRIVMSNEDKTIKHYSETVFYYNLFKIEAIILISVVGLIMIGGLVDLLVSKLNEKKGSVVKEKVA